MPKIVILGSLRFDPYQVTVPQKVSQDYHNEDGYRKACERIYPAIDDADLILVYAPDGIGEHTKRDLDHAISKNKKIIFYIWSS